MHAPRGPVTSNAPTKLVASTMPSPPQTWARPRPSLTSSHSCRTRLLCTQPYRRYIQTSPLLPPSARRRLQPSSSQSQTWTPSSAASRTSMSRQRCAAQQAPCTALTRLLNLMVQGTLPHCEDPLACRLIASSKPGGRGVRLIAIGKVLVHIASLSVHRACIAAGQQLAPLQMGVGIRGGSEAIEHALRVGHAADKQCVTMKVDRPPVYLGPLGPVTLQGMAQPFCVLPCIHDRGCCGPMRVCCRLPASALPEIDRPMTSTEQSWNVLVRFRTTVASSRDRPQGQVATPRTIPANPVHGNCRISWRARDTTCNIGTW